jgi:hypothetical protein
MCFTLYVSHKPFSIITLEQLCPLRERRPQSRHRRHQLAHRQGELREERRRQGPQRPHRQGNFRPRERYQPGRPSHNNCPRPSSDLLRINILSFRVPF